MRTIRIGSPMEVHLKHRIEQLKDEYDARRTIETLNILEAKVGELERIQKLLKTKAVTERR